jgi:hypothetical protein
VEETAVSTFVGSSELGRWGNGGAVERNDWRRSVLGERDGEWCGMLRGGGSPFIGSGGVWRGGYWQEMLAVNGGNDARV